MPQARALVPTAQVSRLHGIGRTREFGIDRRKRDLRFLVGLVVRYGCGRGVS